MYDRKYCLYEGVGMKGSSNAPKIVHSNKNLLDNWDFTNPVNQRGITEYKIVQNIQIKKYTIDRWFITDSDPNTRITIEKDTGLYIDLRKQWANFSQIVPVNNLFNTQKKVTLSFIVDYTTPILSVYIELYDKLRDGTDIQLAGIQKSFDESKVESITINGKEYSICAVTLELPANSKGYLYCGALKHYTDTTAASLRIKAVKLELGEVSTLKNDVLGVSYPEELIKCKQYLWRINATSDAARLFGTCVGHGENLALSNIMLPDNFRKTASAPIIEYSNLSHFKLIKGAEEKAVTGILSSGTVDSSVSVNIYSSGIITGDAYAFVMNKGSWIQFSKEL